ncbi:amino acid adenylation domain-containing protein [Streptomyces sp. NPDC087270]|uniref:non-ribosomal peptide synthetase n=1 Tax=Streptomyces sp. NPDC087270 TaxID=3365774 RepID=UPI00382858B3
MRSADATDRYDTPDTSVLSWAVELTGPLDSQALQRTLRVTLRNPPVGQPAMTRTLDLRHLPAAEQDDAVDRVRREESGALAGVAAEAPARTAVCVLAPDRHVLVVAAPGAWAPRRASVLRDLSRHYRGEPAAGGPGQPGVSPERPAGPGTPRSAEPGGDSGAEQVRRWAEAFKGAERLGLPAEHAGTNAGRTDTRIATRPLAPDVSASLGRAAARLGVDEPALVQAAFAAWLHRHSGQRDLLFGTGPYRCDAGSPRADGTRGGAPLVVVPVRLALTASATPAQLADRCRNAVEEGAALASHAGTPSAAYRDAVGDLAPRAVVSVVPGHDKDPWVPGVAVTTRLPEYHDIGADLTLTVELGARDEVAGRSGPLLALAYRPGSLRPGLAELLLERFEQVLRQSSADPAGVRVGELSIVTARESALPEVARGPLRDYRTGTVPERFAEAAGRYGDRIAVADDHGGTLTYAELDRRTNALAAHLVAIGVRPEHRCAIVYERGVNAIVAVLATIKAGAAYLPVDPAMPVNRMEALFQDADVRTVLTHSRLAERLPGRAARVVALDLVGPDLPAGAGAGPRVPLSAANLAYVIPTSGSTGRPKAVMIEHAALTHFVDMVQDFFELSADDRIAQCAALWFDVSVFEIFAALLIGASVHIAGDDTKLTPGALQTVLRERRATVLMTTPSLLETLDPDGLPDLRVMSVGGEPFSAELTARWAPGRRFVNGYGPAEATVEVVAKVCAGSGQDDPPIGRPLANHSAYVLDERMRPVPVGVAGELYLGGAGLARGYLAQPGPTAAAFLPDPFGAAGGGRLYRTGDLVRRLPDGDLLYVGRTDRQVKVRGMRVELGEVEQAMCRHPEVSRACAVTVTTPDGDTEIVGYAEVRGGGAAADGIRAFTADWLPPYMVPGTLVVMDSLPANSSGKVDMAALSALPFPPAGTVPGQPEAAPLPTATQKAVGEIVREVLRVEDAPVDEDLFALGGNSLQVLRILSRVQSAFGVTLTPQEFFEEPTVLGIAAAVDGRPAHA